MARAPDIVTGGGAPGLAAACPRSVVLYLCSGRADAVEAVPTSTEEYPAPPCPCVGSTPCLRCLAASAWQVHRPIMATSHTAH